MLSLFLYLLPSSAQPVSLSPRLVHALLLARGSRVPPTSCCFTRWRSLEEQLFLLEGMLSRQLALVAIAGWTLGTILFSGDVAL